MGKRLRYCRTMWCQCFVADLEYWQCSENKNGHPFISIDRFIAVPTYMAFDCLCDVVLDCAILHNTRHQCLTNVPASQWSHGVPYLQRNSTSELFFMRLDMSFAVIGNSFLDCVNKNSSLVWEVYSKIYSQGSTDIYPCMRSWGENILWRSIRNRQESEVNKISAILCTVINVQSFKLWIILKM